jgi:hypothetical protein
MAWTALHQMGDGAEEELLNLFLNGTPCHKARALWLLGRLDAGALDGRGGAYVFKGKESEDPNIRITAIRLGRQLPNWDVVDVVRNLTSDVSPQVRRECALALRYSNAEQVPSIWAELAKQHDGQDRWYLEALGIAADGRWDACLREWLHLVGDVDLAIETPAGRDIIWRSRAKATPALLAKIIQSETTDEEEKSRYIRAFDFLSGPEKDAALKSLLGL